MNIRIGELANISQGLATTGSAAGARPGGWDVNVVDSSDIQDDRLGMDDLRMLSIEHNIRTERHLLRPYDVLLTARSTTIKAALVPPAVSRCVAGSTLLVVRPERPELGVGHWLWYYLTSEVGRAQLAARLVASVTISSLSAKAVAEMPVPMPDAQQLHRLASLIEESERAHEASLEAADLRRTGIREAIITSLLTGEH